MPKAEVGSIKHLSNQMKSKGLQRLRWFCQICEKQCRDDNGFKCHVQSESHVRRIQLIGGNVNKVSNDYSQDFQSDFLKLLRTAHGEKSIHINHFYQEYISDKMHVHMNSTRWSSLTEFAKHLGREGICRVEETEKGLHIAWIDNSPEALRRQDALRKKERQDKGDEEREQKLIREQIARAEVDAAERLRQQELDEESGQLRRDEGEKIKLNFGSKPKAEAPPVAPPEVAGEEMAASEDRNADEPSKSASPPSSFPTPPPEKISLKVSSNNKPKNVFAAASKKNALAGARNPAKETSQRPMSQAEKIMKEEIERKRRKEEQFGAGLNKKPRLS